MERKRDTKRREEMEIKRQEERHVQLATDPKSTPSLNIYTYYKN